MKTVILNIGNNHNIGAIPHQEIARVIYRNYSHLGVSSNSIYRDIIIIDEEDDNIYSIDADGMSTHFNSLAGCTVIGASEWLAHMDRVGQVEALNAL